LSTDTGNLRPTQRGNTIRERVEEAANTILASAGRATTFDVLMHLSWLHDGHIKLWQRRHQCFEFLEPEMQSTPQRRRQVLEHFEHWGKERGLETTSVAFFPTVRDPQDELQVTPGGDPQLERLFRLCFIAPKLNEKKRQAIKEKVQKKPDLLVFVCFRTDTCAECDAEIGKGSFVFLSAADVLCLTCADLDRLVFLPSGDVALTRRARKHSRLSAVVLEHNRRLRRQHTSPLLFHQRQLQDPCSRRVSWHLLLELRLLVSRRSLRRIREPLQLFSTCFAWLLPPIFFNSSCVVS